MHFFLKKEKDLVILPDAFFLHPLVVQDMFNIPRASMEMEGGLVYFILYPRASGN